MADIPFSQLIAQADAGLLPVQGMAPNQFVPPQNVVPPGSPGGGGIRGPGMVPGSVPPDLDAALLERATRIRPLPDVGRLPSAAQPHPLTPEEQSLGIQADLSPGMSPYMPHQTSAPSVPGIERMKAMNLSMTPEGMAEHFRNLGFEAQVLPHDMFAERQHPMLAEIESGHGYNITIKEPTTGEWHVLDPQTFEAADLTDILSDAAITVASVAGANIAGGAAATGRHAAAMAAREAAKRSAAAGGGRVGSGAARLARRAAEKAATPSTFVGERTAGAIAGTIPPEVGRQALAGMSDLPEEGVGMRALRLGEELGASAVGEVLDPVQLFRGLTGMRAKKQIDAYRAARRAGEAADMPSPFRALPTEEEMTSGQTFGDRVRGVAQDVGGEGVGQAEENIGALIMGETPEAGPQAARTAARGVNIGDERFYTKTPFSSEEGSSTLGYSGRARRAETGYDIFEGDITTEGELRLEGTLIDDEMVSWLEGAGRRRPGTSGFDNFEPGEREYIKNQLLQTGSGIGVARQDLPFPVSGRTPEGLLREIDEIVYPGQGRRGAKYWWGGTSKLSKAKDAQSLGITREFEQIGTS